MASYIVRMVTFATVEQGATKTPAPAGPPQRTLRRSESWWPCVRQRDRGNRAGEYRETVHAVAARKEDVTSRRLRGHNRPGSSSPTWRPAEVGRRGSSLAIRCPKNGEPVLPGAGRIGRVIEVLHCCSVCGADDMAHSGRRSVLHCCSMRESGRAGDPFAPEGG
jgi:hypothetical protein